MKLEENTLRDLLSGEAEKERRAYKRSTLLMLITVLVGLSWLGFSAYKVVQLERRSSTLSQDIQAQTEKLNDVQERIAEADEALEERTAKLVSANAALTEAESALKSIAAGTEGESPQKQAKTALHNISNPPKPADPPKRVDPPPKTDPPKRPVSLPFLMPIEDVFTIQGRGTIVLGRVERGRVKLDEPVEIVGIRSTRATVVKSIEMFRKMLTDAQVGDTVGLLLSGVERRDVERGQVVAAPGSIKPHTKFTAKVTMLDTEKGGRQTPFSIGYRPQFYFRTTDVTGLVTLPAGKQIMPGEKDIELPVELRTPIAMEVGLRFAIREGGRTVGTGVVTKIIE